MQLFKRLLLSFFPDSMLNSTVSPVTMFVSFISAKEFFSIVNRKIIENYQLNLFDVSIDPFEFKMGFGDTSISSKSKELDLYYGYAASANLNGYKYYNPANMATGITMMSSLYFKDVFSEYDDEYFVDFLYTLYLLPFLFVSRIKVFPFTDEKENFNWFVDVLFSFFQVAVGQLKHTLPDQTLKSLKKDLLIHSDVFFMLYRYFQRLNILFAGKGSDKDLFSWILKQEMNKEEQEFVALYDTTKHASNFSFLEQEMLFRVAPADIHIKYLFLSDSPSAIVDCIIASVYDKKILDEKMKTFLSSDAELDFILDYVMDYKNFKQGFFLGVQKYISFIFRNEMDDELMEEFDEMMSAIGDDIEQLENLKVPERLKKESKIMEQIMNFYITFVGGLSIARGDSFFLKVYKPQLIEDVLKEWYLYDQSEKSLYYYGNTLYQYGKNQFFYTVIGDHIRAGRQKFVIPLHGDTKKVSSNLAVLRLFDENFLSVFLQDVNPKQTKLYVKNSFVLEKFRVLFEHTLSDMLKKEKADFLSAFYFPALAQLSKNKHFVSTLGNHFQEHDIYRLRESLYSLDYWISRGFYEKTLSFDLKSEYSDQVLFGLFSHAREFLLGFLLYIRYLRSLPRKGRATYREDTLFHFFVKDILYMDGKFYDSFLVLLRELELEFAEMLDVWIEFDDNKEFFGLVTNYWKSFLTQKAKQIANYSAFSGEDAIWFRGFLKNVTYYNKRYLIPT